MSQPLLGIRYVLIATLAFAVQDGTSKYLAALYPPEFFITIRYWLFAIFVTVLAARRAGGLRAAVRTKMPLTQVFRGVLLATQIVVIVTSFDLIGLGATHAIFSLHPLLATCLAIPLLGERVGWHRAGAVALGLIGMLIILRPGTGVFDFSALAALVAAAMMALYTVATRMVGRADGASAPAFFYLGVGGAAALTLIGPFYWTAMAPADIGWLLVHSGFAMFGHYFLIRALEVTEAVRIQPFTYLQMIYAIPVGVFVFGESVDRWVILGMSLVVAAGLYSIWREARQRRS